MRAEEKSPSALSGRVRQQLLELGRLAWPTVIARAGILTMVLVDVLMVGRFSTEELAYASLGSSLFVPLLVIGVGLMVGVATKTAQAYGAGRYGDCGLIWYHALPFAAMVGIISATICMFGEALLTLFGHEPELAREAGKVAAVLAPGLIGYCFFVVSTNFLEGLQKPGPGMLAMLIANALNIALNWVFIFGNLGMPAMGAVGSALTTSIVRFFLGAAMVWYILRMTEGAQFGLSGWPGKTILKGWWAKGAQARKIGYAGGMSIGLETTAHAVLAQFAGILGVLPIAAFSIAANVEGVMFMIALGFGSATAVLVGNAWGKGDVAGARLAGWVGLFTNLFVMSLCGGLIYVFRQPIASAYSTDPVLILATMPLMAIVAWVVVADGAQLTLAQAVRGLGDTWPATWRYAVAFWGVMVPLAWWLSLHKEYGASGLLYAMGVACFVSMILQGSRFATVLRDAS